MIEARAAQKLGRSVAVARVLPPSLPALALAHQQGGHRVPRGKKERSSDPPLSAAAAVAPPTEASPSPPPPLSTTEIKALDNAALVPSRFTFM